MSTYAPEAAVLRETLEKLLDSETFARSERARELLVYLIDQEQAGQADRLKGFSIAVDVFGKDSEFDSSTDALVRVQAGRLRDLLQQYFADEGADEPLRITIPRGSYVPRYARASEPTTAVALLPEALSSEENAAPPVSPVAAKAPRFRRRPGASYFMRQVRMFWAAFAVVIGMLGFVAYNSYTDGLPPQLTSTANAAPANRLADAIVSLPKLYLSVEGEGAPQKVAKVLRAAMSGFDTIVYISRPPPASGNAAPLDFAFKVGPGPEEHTVGIVLEDIRTGQVIVSRTIEPAILEGSKLEDRIADIATATLTVSGALYGFLEQNSLQRGLTNCLLLNDDYYLDQKSGTHKLAYDCFNKMLSAGAHSPLIYSELAALELEAVTDAYGYPPDASKDDALAMARRAVQMAPTSPYAHRAYGFLHKGLGNGAESVKWMKKANELGHFDLTMAAAYGYALIMAGHYAEGTPVMSRAVSNCSARPSWWDYSLFLGEFMLDNKQAAADATDALSTTKRAHYVAARLLAAKLRGDAAEAERLVDTLVENHKKFANNPRKTYTSAGYPDDMIEKLLLGLAKAGLGNES